MITSHTLLLSVQCSLLWNERGGALRLGS